MRTARGLYATPQLELPTAVACVRASMIPPQHQGCNFYLCKLYCHSIAHSLGACLVGCQANCQETCGIHPARLQQRCDGAWVC